MGNFTSVPDETKKPVVPSRDSDGYRLLSKKVEEIKLEERIKEYYIVE